MQLTNDDATKVVMRSLASDSLLDRLHDMNLPVTALTFQGNNQICLDSEDSRLWLTVNVEVRQGR